ncbi:hypothetical protein [Chroococcidiopsis sp.]|uniref:hypothetical protein n=1 Tax=Chroococcidiopsis sp. TaxID=3088168 RepID=UPI003F2FA785
MRSSVLEIVMQAPSSGLTSRAIRQKLALRTSLQRLRGHLKKLEELGLIHSQLDPTHRLRLIYFPGSEPGQKPEPIDNAQVIRAVIAQEPQGINFRSVTAKCQLGISPSQMVWELRNLIESGVIVCKSDPKHKRRFLYFTVNNNAISS